MFDGKGDTAPVPPMQPAPWRREEAASIPWTFGRTLAVGSQGLLLLLALLMTLSGALALCGIVLGAVVLRSLMRSARAVGLGRLLASMVITFGVAAGGLFLLALLLP